MKGTTHGTMALPGPDGRSSPRSIRVIASKGVDPWILLRYWVG